MAQAGDRARSEGASRPVIWRLLPLLVIGFGTVGIFASGADAHLSLAGLQQHRAALSAWIGDNPVSAAAAFVGGYALAVLCVPPSATILTIAGGFLFGAGVGLALAVVGASIGATLVFLAARFALADLIKRCAGPAIARLEAGFRCDAFSYMLFLRLVPLFPFWLVNLAPALLGVRLRTTVIATTIGIIPGTAVYAVFGAGLGTLLDRNQPVTIEGVMTLEILAALIGLAVLALVPVVYRRWKRQAERAAVGASSTPQAKAGRR
jgi:uncharacterized membrane protein YdjX (TVP38/TMEM64 family)